MSPEITRTVSVRLVFNASRQTSVILQLAPLEFLTITESLTVNACDQTPEIIEVVVPRSGRLHLFHCDAGRCEVMYSAAISGRVIPQPVDKIDAITYLRPSRYAEADKLKELAESEFQGIANPFELLSAVSSWVAEHLSYVPGDSLPTDGAVEAWQRGSGVCRDYGHVVIALLRALDIPARLTAAYAPGLTPMDFHAVAEAAIEGSWYVVDATLLAPREDLLKICTGRDAADTAFMSTYGGDIQLLESEVSATVNHDLPIDHVDRLVKLS